MTQIKELSTLDMSRIYDNPNILLVDIRPVEAYNGWKLHGEERGGHIKNAKSFPYEWTHYYFELKELLDNKGITPKQSVIIYGYDREETEQFARMLLDVGYVDVKCYHHFEEEWTQDKSLLMDHLPNYHQLVYPEWVHSLISGEKPPHYKGNHYVILHSHYDYLDDYKQGHIPQAIPMNTMDLESEVTWNRRSPEELKATLEKHGITKDSTVVLYGRFSNPDNNDPYPGRSAGHLGAIRCAAILLYAGVKDVKVLNGGISRWEQAGYDTTSQDYQPQPVNDFGGEIPGRPEVFADLPEAKELLESDSGDLVSIRSYPEIIGEVSGYNYIETKGRIPGAIFGNCGTDAYHMENYRNVDHTTREYHEIAQNWLKWGISPDKHLAFYCGTGWRGSEAFFNAWLMGYSKISVFDGGWFEWTSHPENPIVTGVPKEMAE